MIINKQDKIKAVLKKMTELKRTISWVNFAGLCDEKKADNNFNLIRLRINQFNAIMNADPECKNAVFNQFDRLVLNDMWKFYRLANIIVKLEPNKETKKLLPNLTTKIVENPDDLYYWVKTLNGIHTSFPHKSQNTVKKFKTLKGRKKNLLKSFIYIQEP